MRKKTPIKSKKKNKNMDFALAYSVFNSKFPSENKSLLKDFLERGIEQEAALILSSAASNLWNPKKKVTMSSVKKGKIEHSYEHLINAYYCFCERGNNPIKSAFLAEKYMEPIYHSISMEGFEKLFNQREKSLGELLR